MNVLIVEDETAAADYLGGVLHEAAPQCRVLGVTESVEQTLEWLDKNPLPDLILMDIHLSDGSSFALFEKRDIPVPIIFTTAYDQYALQAFKVNSIDYLLKPVSPDALRKALDKWQRLSHAEIRSYLQRLNSLAEPVPPACPRLLLPLGDQLLPISLDEIACFYTTGRRTLVLLHDGRQLPWNKTLDAVMAQLGGREDFIRANKQYILSRASVRKLVIWFDNRLRADLVVPTPEPVYISKNKAAEFKEWLVR